MEIEEELIKQSVQDNKDGWGIAQSIKGKLVVDKGMNADEYIEYVKSIPKEQAAIIHTRIGTCGGKALYNCHPFRLSEDLCLMHNGGITIDRPFKEMSDTWHFAFEIVAPMLKRKPELINDEAFISLMGSAVESRNKVVLMNAAGQISIINRKEGNEYKGLWLSNGRSNYGQHWPSKPYSGSTTYTPGQQPHVGHNHHAGGQHKYNNSVVQQVEEFYG